MLLPIFKKKPKFKKYIQSAFIKVEFFPDKNC